MLGYSAYVLKRVFELDLGRLVLKTALFFVIFLGFSLAGELVYGGYILKDLANGALKDSPFNNVIKEGFEKGEQMKIKEDSLKRVQDSIENKRTLVIDSLAH